MKIKIFIYLTVLLILAVASLIVLLRKDFILGYLEREKILILDSHQGYSELFFENNKQLPRVIYASESGQFEFTIKNNEGTSKNYSYETILQASSGAIMNLSSGTLTISNGDNKTIPVKYTIPEAIGKSKVRVYILDTSYNIHFWTEIKEKAEVKKK